MPSQQSSILSDGVSALHAAVAANPEDERSEEVRDTASRLTATLPRDLAACITPDCLQLILNILQATCRMLDVHVANRDDIWVQATTLLANSLLLSASIESKFLLKARLSGLLQKLATYLSADENASETMLRLMAVLLRSARNAMLLGKDQDFLSLFARVLNTKQHKAQSLDLLMAYAELLFFLANSSKNRCKLLDTGVLSALLHRTLLIMPKDNTQVEAIQACLVLLGCIKLLIRSKRGRERLLSDGGVVECEKLLALCADLVPPGYMPDPMLLKLQSALCHVCLRCVPSKTYPLADVKFPLAFKLPQNALLANQRVSASNLLVPNSAGDGASSGGSEVDEDDDDGGVTDGDDTLELVRARSTVPLVHDVDDLEDPVFIKKDEEEDAHKNEQQPQTVQPADYEHVQAQAAFYAEWYSGASELPDAARALAFEQRLLSRRPSRSPPIDQLRYQELSAATRSVVPFVKLAYPDWTGAFPNLPLQPLKLFPDAFRSTVMATLSHEQRSQPQENKSKRMLPAARTVFDLDVLLKDTVQPDCTRTNSTLHNNDAQLIGKPQEGVDHLLFESRFECGNLRRAVQTDHLEYELFMSPDIASRNPHHQWFYFQVSNMQPDVSYVFQIVNALKSRSMFSFGMQPVLFSVQEAVQGRPGWVRAGHTICYYRNQYSLPSNKPTNSKLNTDMNKNDGFYTNRFSICFRHAYDVCYVAFHYPYTYTYLLTQLSLWNNLRSSELYYRLDTLCTSAGGNPVPLLTVTGRADTKHVQARPYVVLSARVHPGETNSSWMMHGAISFLLSDHAEARQLRAKVVFKIIPMLNPDGVINGSHRCSLSGNDLNRQWAQPDPNAHPEIWHCKHTILHLTQCMVDMHGHSKKFNVFAFGNDPDQSWLPRDRQQSHAYEFLDLPELLERQAPSFSLRDCAFSVQRAKESTARVVAWREMGIQRAYTLESTFAGADQGPYAGEHLGTRELQEMGRCLCEAINDLLLKIGD